MLHYQHRSAPSLETLCVHSTVSVKSIRRYISLFMHRVVELSSDIPFSLNKMNFVAKIPDIIQYKGVIIFNSGFHLSISG